MSLYEAAEIIKFTKDKTSKIIGNTKNGLLGGTSFVLSEIVISETIMNG